MHSVPNKDLKSHAYANKDYNNFPECIGKIKWKVYIKSVYILFAVHLQKGIDYLHTLNDFTYSTLDDDVRWNISKKIDQLLVSNIFMFFKMT